jgi:tetratricopeptide (TPR) repeat protein
VKRISLFRIGIKLPAFLPAFLSTFLSPLLPTALLFILLILLLTGCSFRTRNSLELLNGVLGWNAGDYQSSVASFLLVTENAREKQDNALLQYGLYGLSVTYLMQNEHEAALSRIAEISADAGDDILYGAWYNSGILAWNQGDFTRAADSFRQALRIRPSSIDAKINLEKSLVPQGTLPQEAPPASAPGSTPSGAQEVSEAGEVLFSIIRAKEENQWKNQEEPQVTSGVPDY